MEGSFFTHESSYVDAGAVVGAGTKVWHFSHIQSGAIVGKNCVIGQNVNISGGASVGDGCKLQNNVSVYEGVTLEDGVFCGPSCVFTNDHEPRAHSPHGWEVTPTLVKKGASIGANATIVCGNTLGEYCMVGSGAVVTRNVPAYALVVGVPARQIGWVCSCGQKLDRTFQCACGKTFELLGEDLKETVG